MYLHVAPAWQHIGPDHPVPPHWLYLVEQLPPPAVVVGVVEEVVIVVLNVVDTLLLLLPLCPFKPCWVKKLQVSPGAHDWLWPASLGSGT